MAQLHSAEERGDLELVKELLEQVTKSKLSLSLSVPGVKNHAAVYIFQYIVVHPQYTYGNEYREKTLKPVTKKDGRH